MIGDFQLLLIRFKKEMQVINKEAKILYQTALKQQNIPGDYAEAGVYKGGTAKLISKAKGKKTLHLFDTFQGLPSPTTWDKKESGNPFKAGEWKGTLEEVKDFLKKEKNIVYHVGLVQETTKTLDKQKYSFVHLDLDLYESTKTALEYFYPRLNLGGVLISHDYTSCPGVKKAFEEYFSTKPETIEDLKTTQCKVTKRTV